MLTSIELTGFRGFRQLKLDGLQRVNLIVGKNNSGKTSLLEGICGVINNTVNRVTLRPQDASSGQWFASTEDSQMIVKGTWQNTGQLPVSLPQPDEYDSPHCRASVIPVFHSHPDELVPKLGMALLDPKIEEQIESLLRQVDPRVKRLRIDPSVPGNRIVLDVGLKRMVPLSQMGQGIYRLIEIFAEIISMSPKICLIDEIENGIHHSSLIDLWRGLAEISEQFGVQIFATTHSHECVEAAHEAFSERTSYDLSVIQLFRKTVSVQGRVLDQEHIAAAMDGKIDLRG